MLDDPKQIQKMALAITRAVGSPASILLHTIAFVSAFFGVSFGFFSFDRMLLVLTTIVSLEAIYLAIFIQMTINYTSESLKEVEHDVEEIQKDIDEIQEDVEDISEDVEEMTEEENAEAVQAEDKRVLASIQADVQKLLADIERLKHNHQ